MPKEATPRSARLQKTLVFPTRSYAIRFVRLYGVHLALPDLRAAVFSSYVQCTYIFEKNKKNDGIPFDCTDDVRTMNLCRLGLASQKEKPRKDWRPTGAKLKPGESPNRSLSNSILRDSPQKRKGENRGLHSLRIGKDEEVWQDSCRNSSVPLPVMRKDVHRWREAPWGNAAPDRQGCSMPEAVV